MMDAHDEESERGSATLETAILVPALILVLALLLAGGRVALARNTVEQVAADAARIASASTANAAAGAARGSAQRDLEAQGIRCSAMTVNVDTSGFSRPAGSAATVTARVSCTVQLADLLLPGMPASLTLTGSGTSVIDTYKERS